MIGRQRAVARGERRAAEIGELVGVQLDGKSARPRRIEDAGDLLRRKRDALAEPVDGVDQAFRGERRQHIAGNAGDVAVRVARGFRRQGVGAEEGCPHGDVARRTEPARDAQRLSLVGEVEPVARLDLDRRHAFGDQRVEARQRLGEQRVFVRSAQRPDRRDNAAAGARHLLVCGAVEAHLELVGPVSGMNEMGMAVDQARRDPAATAVDRLGARGERLRNVGLRSGVDDTSGLDGNRTALDGAEPGPPGGQRRQPGVAEQTRTALLVGAARHLSSGRRCIMYIHISDGRKPRVSAPAGKSATAMLSLFGRAHRRRGEAWTTTT